MDPVTFTRMRDGTKEDFTFPTAQRIAQTRDIADRLLDALVSLDDGQSGDRIGGLGHSLLSATRVERDEADNDWIVSGLLHDFGGIFAHWIRKVPASVCSEQEVIRSGAHAPPGRG